MLMNARKTATKLVSKVIKKHGKLRFFTLVELATQMDPNTLGSNLWRFLTIAHRWNVPINCSVDSLYVQY